MATPATGDGKRPFSSDPPPAVVEPPPRPRTRFSTKTLIQQPPPDVVVPPPRPRPRRAKKVPNQPPPVTTTSTTTIPEPPTTTTSTISEPSPATIPDPSPATTISEPSPTSTSSILSKLRPPSLTTPNPEFEQAQGIKSPNSLLLRPSPSMGPSTGPSTGHLHTQATICAGHDVHERGREEIKKGEEEKLEDKDYRGPLPPSPSTSLVPHHEQTPVQSQQQRLDATTATSVHGENDMAEHHFVCQSQTATTSSPPQHQFSPTIHATSTLHTNQDPTTISHSHILIPHPYLSPTQPNTPPTILIPHLPLSPTQPNTTHTNLIPQPHLSPSTHGIHNLPTTHTSVVPATKPNTNPINLTPHYPLSPTQPNTHPTYLNPHPPLSPTNPNTHTIYLTSHQLLSPTPPNTHHTNIISHHHLSPTPPNTQPPSVDPTLPHPPLTSTSHVSPTTSSHFPHTIPSSSTNPSPLSQAHTNTPNTPAQSLPPSTPNQPIPPLNPTITPQAQTTKPTKANKAQPSILNPSAHNQAPYPPGPTYASVLNSNGPPKKSFADLIHGPTPPLVPLKSVSLFNGEPSVQFSAAEIQAMAAPFKMTLVGKFSYNRPRMDLIRQFFASVGLLGKSQISLLDNRHVLIKLTVEDDYTRLWVKQTWYVCGSAMRIFKWTTDFRCSEESPVVPVWVSFPYLPIHFVQCKEALFSIASVVGQPLRIDQATASLSRPSVARVLVEHDVTQPLLPRIRIGVGDTGFWQSVVYEKIPPYCASCKHLGHAAEACYVANPSLRPQRPNRATPADPPLGKDRAATPPDNSPRVPDPTPERSSLAIQIVDSGSPITVIFPAEADGPISSAAPDFTPEPQDSRAPDSGASLPCDLGEIAELHLPADIRSFSDNLDTAVVSFNTHCTEVPSDVDISEAEDSPDSPPGDIGTTVVGFNTHCTAIPSSEETSVDGETSDGIETGGDVEICDGAIIEKLGDQRIIRCSEGFIEVTPRRRSCIHHSHRRRRRPL